MECMNGSFFFGFRSLVAIQAFVTQWGKQGGKNGFSAGMAGTG